MIAAMQSYGERHRCIGMWSSDACWKNDQTIVTWKLKKRHSQSAKYNPIKENIKSMHDRAQQQDS